MPSERPIRWNTKAARALAEAHAYHMRRERLRPPTPEEWAALEEARGVPTAGAQGACAAVAPPLPLPWPEGLRR